jgi:hypothetical protein
VLQQGRKTLRRAAALAVAGLAVAASAADDPPAAAPVPLDRLLKLPAASVGSATGEERYGRRTRSDWEGRFQGAAAELVAARKALADSRKKLEEIAPDKGWSMSAPGMPVSAEESPLDFKLRQEMRRQREEVERAERRLDELTVEANLAGVPEDWRGAKPSEGAPAPGTAPRAPPLD